jgi:hypothetical protein
MVRKFTTAVELPGDPASGLQATTKDYVDTVANGRVLTSRSILAGTGLTGGGDLSVDRSLAVAYGTTASTAAVGNDSRLSDARSPSGTAGGALNGSYPNPLLDVVPWPPVTLTDAATIVTDASLGNHFRVVLGGNRTLGNPTNPTDGQRVTWELIQDATGTRTLALGSAFALGTSFSSITLTTTLNKRDFLGAIYNSITSLWYVVAFMKGY